MSRTSLVGLYLIYLALCISCPHLSLQSCCGSFIGRGFKPACCCIFTANSFLQVLVITAQVSGCRRHVMAEELDAGFIMQTLPAIRVSVHRPHQQAAQPGPAQPCAPAQPGGLPPSAATGARGLSLEGLAQPPAAPVAPAAPQPGPAEPPAVPQGEATEAVSVMHKATAALHRFNQLKESLLQHEVLQQKLSSRLSSLQVGRAQCLVFLLCMRFWQPCNYGPWS